MSSDYKIREAYEILKEAKGLADQISRFVNRMSGGRERAIALGKELANDHRTLQQTHMAMVLSFLEEQARNFDEDLFDARNEHTVKMASEMMANVNHDLSLPYI